MKLRINESDKYLLESKNRFYYKNVDICDLPSILSKGILPLNRIGNNNWDSGKRANNSKDVVYLFVPTGYENSFVQYGAALLEIDAKAQENELDAKDINRGKYIEYVCDSVSQENIKHVYIPKIFKNKIHFRHPKIKWVDMEAKIFSSELYDKNLEKYGIGGTIFKKLPNDFDEIRNFEDCDDTILKLFADTAQVEDSSSMNYFRGELPNRETFDLHYIHYNI